jgi:hypothetical protein
VPHKISDETSGNKSYTSVENNTYILNIKYEHTCMYKLKPGRSPKVSSIKNERIIFFEFYLDSTMIENLAIKGLH